MNRYQPIIQATEVDNR